MPNALKRICILVSLLALFSCRQERIVNTSFYYWKTVYETNPTEEQYVDALKCKKLYLRIMDVDNVDGATIPVSPITFKTPVPDSVTIVPVVFIVNQVLKDQTEKQLDDLAYKIVRYVDGRIKQSGKSSFNELQIDCDWTRSTRDKYFHLLKRIRTQASLKNKIVSATLRLHQLKNQRSSGIPPVDRVMLMCYNMGNLRLYGMQNSILDQGELEKYVNQNLSNYSLPVDIGLPLFSWAVVFRHKQYAGIAKRVNALLLTDKKLFQATNRNMYLLKTDLPGYGLKQGDEIRWETIPAPQMQDAADYLQSYISTDTVNIIYFHLDEPTLKNYNYETLEKTSALFR